MTAIAQRNRRTALWMALLVAAMIGLAFASPALYRTFCSLTGFGGTPLRAERAPGAVAGQVALVLQPSSGLGMFDGHRSLPIADATVGRTARRPDLSWRVRR